MAGKTDPIAERLVLLRRNQILDAATTVFASRGFHRTTIKDIAQTAGIADGTIYTYFKSKADVLVGLLDRLNESEQREEQMMDMTEQDIKGFFVAYVRHRMATLWPNAEVFQAVLPELLTNAELRTTYYQQVVEPTMEIAEHGVQILMDQGQIRRIDIPLSVRALGAMIFGLLVLQLLGDQQIASRWEELPEILATMIFDGLQLKDPLSTEREH